MNNLYTIGYSSYTLDSLVKSISFHGVNALVDVRSTPYSAFKPEFNKEEFKAYLKTKGIQYVFLGDECGARTTNESCYVNGKVDFNKIRTTNSFKHGIDRILTGLSKYTVALMCSEKDPMHCHRTILICSTLKKYNVNIIHIIDDKKVEKHSETEERLLKKFNLYNDMFISTQDALDKCYLMQWENIAFSSTEGEESNNVKN